MIDEVFSAPACTPAVFCPWCGEQHLVESDPEEADGFICMSCLSAFHKSDIPMDREAVL